MKYFYEKPKVWEKRGTTYYCDFPYYNACTLFLKEGKGLAVVQKRFNKKAKCASFGPLDPWLAYDIYENDRFGHISTSTLATKTNTERIQQ